MNQIPGFINPKRESGSKKFWRIVLGSMLGFFISSIVLSILSLIFFFGIIASVTTSSVPSVADNSILKLSLNTVIEERGEENPFENTAFQNFANSPVGLDDIINCIDKAATDPKIKGISLEVSTIQAGMGTLQEIYNALSRFKESGKFIYAYGDYYSQKGYYLSTIADQIFINKLGSIDFKGMALKTMFFKGLLEKLEVDVQVVRHGEFKSAVEPFILDKMSEANREQMTVLASDIWNVLVSQVSLSRGISVESLQLIANQLLCENATACLKYKMIDSISYYSSYENSLRNLIQIKTDKKINYVSISDYRKTITTTTNENNIAIVYAVGDIIDGEGDENSIGSITFCKELRKAYTNDKVKAIVIRINSPGGSALASEAIWNEIELAKKSGKIIVTSMGDYAASGGYYIACNSDAIVAQPTTLTGSIGVFGLIPSVQKMLKNKLGITYDVVKTNEHADYDSGRLLNEYELSKIKISIEEIYELFTQRVATGRKMKIEEVYKIGEGRVWTGFRAKEIGLVDKLGGLDVAIATATELAKITNYGILIYPSQPNWFEKMFGNQNKTSMKQALGEEFGELYFAFDAMKSIIRMKGVQARIPMTIEME
ncbi:MAG: signal peptide peptidase SppA [Bacteroidetes bacterium HGW-Bacteroidetes-20]|nr:MAG: signal peptide peptidase SppA [Bacteroidetes bacterium HGW-Bacteroidetes-20]